MESEGLGLGEAIRNEKESFPDVVVKICEQMYAINSRYIISIYKMQTINSFPGASNAMLGFINFRGEAIPLLDMRLLFGYPTIKQDFEAFQKMIDERKQDHVNWVDKLEESINTGNQFTLATDPHQCAFGKWFYHFQTDSISVSHHLKKIEEPHRKLHELALQVDRCKKAATNEESQDCLHNLVKKARNQYMTQIIDLLDETKNVFESIYSEMIIVLKSTEHQVAIVVDAVLAVEELLHVNHDQILLQNSSYFCNVKQQKGSDALIIELNDEKLLTSVEL